MPFDNEDKIPFKDLPICHQQEVIDVLAGKNTDCDTYFYYTGTNWLKQIGGRESVYFNTIYKVVQKDIVMEIDSFGGIRFDADFLPLLQPGKYKLLKIEE